MKHHATLSIRKVYVLLSSICKTIISNTNAHSRAARPIEQRAYPGVERELELELGLELEVVLEPEFKRQFDLTSGLDRRA